MTDSSDSSTPASAQPTVLLDRPAAGVVVLTLHNPSLRNAMTDEVTAAWRDRLEEVRRDPDVRAVVVTGSGTAFTSGGNTAWIASEPDATVARLRERMEAFYRDWLEVMTLQVPTIAAINGPAIGAGLCLALACDIRYAATDAKLAMPFVKLGMHPGMLATHLLPLAVGPARARELLLTGRNVLGEEAERIGMVSAALPADQVLATALQTATQIAANAPVATRLTKLALQTGGHATAEAALHWEALAQAVTLATEDLQEGIAAARERRVPRFAGR